MARDVDMLIRRAAPGNPILTAMPVMNVGRYITSASCPAIVNSAQMHLPAPVGRRRSTCKVPVRFAGHPVEAVVDTGASSSAITLDCLRKAGLDHLVDLGR